MIGERGSPTAEVLVGGNQGSTVSVVLRVGEGFCVHVA